MEALGLDHGRQKLYGKVLYPTNSDPQEYSNHGSKQLLPLETVQACPGSLSTKTNSEVELDHRSGPHHAAAIRPLRPPKFPPKRNVTSVFSGGSPALSGADSTIAIASGVHESPPIFGSEVVKQRRKILAKLPATDRNLLLPRKHLVLDDLNQRGSLLFRP